MKKVIVSTIVISLCVFVLFTENSTTLVVTRVQNFLPILKHQLLVAGGYIVLLYLLYIKLRIEKITARRVIFQLFVLFFAAKVFSTVYELIVDTIALVIYFSYLIIFAYLFYKLVLELYNLFVEIYFEILERLEHKN